MFPRRAHLALPIFMASSVMLLLLGLLWLLNPATPTRAQSQPEALGSVSGVVRNAQGDPVPNITVWLEHYQNVFPPRQVTSNAQGVYEFFSVFSGNYVLRFEDKAQQYASNYYTDAAFAEDGEVITVNGNNVTGINMQLQVGGAISVTLQDSTATTATVYYVTLYRQTQRGQWTNYRSASLVGGEGSVGIAALPIGNYRLCAEVLSPYLSLPTKECYNNVLPELMNQLPPTASDIPVQSGQETAITVVLNDITQVEGYVLNENEQPLADVSVALRPYGMFGGYATNLALTDENGYFRFGFIERGDYSLIFNYYSSYPYGTPSNYLKVYYPNEFASVNAGKISIGSSTYFSVTKKLTPGASIVGKVALPNDVPAGYANVGIYRLRQDNSWSQPGDCYEDCPYINYNYETGVFTITQLPPGTFRLRADLYVPNSSTYLSGFYGGDTFETADDIVLSVGETRGNARFVLGGTEFNSGIAGVVTANGEPKAGIEVGLFSPYNFAPSGVTLPLVQTTTDAEGRYRLEGLAIGNYSVGFHDPAGIYATAFYSDATYLYEQIIITQTGILQGINMALSPGGTIQGHVRTEAGKQPGGFSIQVLYGPSDIYTPYPLRYVGARTDANGFFEVTGLPPGNYFLLATTPLNSAEYPYSTIRYYPDAPDIYIAQVITVTAGQIQEGRNIYFSPRPTYYLPRLGSGTPAPDETPNAAATATATPTWTPGPPPPWSLTPTATPALSMPIQ